MPNDDLDILTSEIIGAAIEVHRTLGPGLLESAYHIALNEELKIRGHNVQSEVCIPAFYKGKILETSYRADIIVDDKVILELKATEYDSPIFVKQLTTYLKLADKRVGLLINFNKSTLTKGVTRVVNKY